MDFVAWNSHLFAATACSPGGLTGETVAHATCRTCAAAFLCQRTGAPADTSSVRWSYQSVSLLGSTNNPFFNFIAGNSILIINTGQSCNSRPIASSGAYLRTFPFILHFKPIFVFLLQASTKPISGEFKGPLSLLKPRIHHRMELVCAGMGASPSRGGKWDPAMFCVKK